MIQEAALRVSDCGFAPPIIICNESHRFIVAEQVQEAGLTPGRLILEPVGRNTAPAVVSAALVLARSNPDAIMVVLPSDHAIADRKGFLAAIESAANVADQLTKPLGVLPSLRKRLTGL